MFIKRVKKAQFFLLAAVIIIAIIISLAAVVNYVQVKEKPKKFYDLSSNLNLEGANLIRYGLYEKKDIDKIIQNFTSIFSEYIESTTENTNLVIVSGDIENVSVRIINRTSIGGVGVELGSTPTRVYDAINNEILLYSLGNLTLTPQVSIILSDNTVQNITLTTGQNFVFVLTNSRGFETYVNTNKNQEQL